jgi:ubiquinone/menaquinone biosynthesis C-methylase UbiE
MNPETYYRDHWVEIDPERLAAYEQMFEWRPLMDPLLAPAAISAGQRVVDDGCGPGGLAVELARRVGDGHVHAIDLNETFVERARERAAREDLAERITVHHVSNDRIPLADASVDRVISKNVLEYVADLSALLAEFHRVLRPGGMAHVIDSDWGLLALEPIGAERLSELFAAASVAYRTPLIGRKLYGVFREAGFADVRVQVLTPADTSGFLAPIVFNMAAYARASGRMEKFKIDRLLEDLERAIEEETYLLVLPQFLVTGTR